MNGVRLKKQRQIDWREQYEKAIEAFEKQQILILVDDRQLDSLEEGIEIKPGVVVSFLRLMLLVRGIEEWLIK